jgi:hypothetical protein
VTDLAVLLGYTALSCAYFGRALLPHPGRTLVGTDSSGVGDADIFVWSFAWWPHALGSATNPFVTHAIYAPHGVNLAWTASAPGLALAFSPLTVLVGPDVSYNVAALLAPALSAWTAFLLVRYLTRSTWAAVVGGYLFGFSSYLIGHLYASHLNLTGVFLVPLVALAIVRYARAELDDRGLAWRLGVLLGVQFWISTEVALTLTLALAAGLLLAILLVRDVRRRLVRSLAAIAAGYVLAAVVAAPLVAYVLSGYGTYSNPVDDAGYFSTDLLNLVVPTFLTEFGGAALEAVEQHFPGMTHERGSYLGLPTLVIVAAFAVRARRSATARFLLSALALAAVLALGPTLHIDGHALVSAPWAVVSDDPLLRNVLPARFALYVSLAAAVIVGIWLASTAGAIARRPVVLPLLAAAAVMPALGTGAFHHVPERWPFFTAGLYERCVPRGETLAVFPFGRFGGSMLWQAETGFRFRLAGGHIGQPTQPRDFVADPVVSQLLFAADRPTLTQLLDFASRHGVDRFVSVGAQDYPNQTMLHGVGAVQMVGGALVAPACGYTSLAGDRRNFEPDNRDFAGEAVVAVVRRDERRLGRARALLAGGRNGAARDLLTRTYADLRLLAAYDSTTTLLPTAAHLAARARSILSGPADTGEVRRAGSSIDAAGRWLRLYATVVDAGGVPAGAQVSASPG